MKARSVAATLGLIFTLMTLGAGGAFAEEELSAKEIMRLVDRMNSTDDSQREMKMTLINKKGKTREREVISYQKKIDEDNDKALVRFIAPGDVAGVGLLTIEHSDREDDQWLYMPAQRKTRRISAADKSDSFMGTDFSYDDMSSMKLDEYDYKILGREAVDGVETIMIESIPNNEQRREESGYSKSVSWVDPTRYVMVKGDFYNLKGEHIKTLTLSEYKQHGEIWMPDRMEMVTLKRDHRTVLEFSNTRINQGLDDGMFTERTLLRGR